MVLLFETRRRCLCWDLKQGGSVCVQCDLKQGGDVCVVI